jgi:hypothetical protein
MRPYLRAKLRDGDEVRLDPATFVLLFSLPNLLIHRLPTRLQRGVGRFCLPLRRALRVDAPVRIGGLAADGASRSIGTGDGVVDVPVWKRLAVVVVGHTVDDPIRIDRHGGLLKGFGSGS